MKWTTPAQKFLDDLWDVVNRWKEKPPDDGITTAEAVGCLTILTHDLLEDNRDESITEEPDDDDPR